MLRAALKSLLGRKVRLLMSTFAIVLGVAFVAGTLVFSDTLNRSFTALFASTVGDVVVRPEGAVNPMGDLSTLTVPAEVAADLERVDGAARVDGNVNATNVVVLDEDDKVVGGFGPPSLGSNWTGAPAGHGLEGLVMTEGRVPDGPEEVALDAGTAEKAGYVVGDTVTLNTAGATATLEPTLVGIADFREGGSLNGATLTIFDTATAQELFLDGADAYSDLWVTAEDGVSQEELRDRVEAELPDGLEAVTGDDAADEAASDLLEAISFLTTFLLIFAGIALVVGAFLIVNTFSILVAQRSRELALLRALGASKRQVLGSVQLEALVLGLLGATLGLGLGVLLAIGLRAVFAQVGLDLSGQSLIFAPRTVLAAYAIGVLVTMAAALLPALRTTRIAPVQALRDDVVLPESSIQRRLQVGVVLVLAGLVSLFAGLGDVVEVPHGGWFVGAGVLAILLGVAAASPVISRPFLVLARVTFARLFGTVGNLAGQNSLRNPRRTTATASALMIGLTLACTMAIVGDSAKASVDKSIEDNFVGDYVVSNVVAGSFSPEVAERMRAVDGVVQVVRQRYTGGTIDGEPQGVVGIDADGAEFLELTAAAGDVTALREGTVLLQETYADDEDLQVGDDLEIEMPAGDQRWEVVGIYEDNPVLFFPIVTTVDTLLATGAQDKDNALIIDVDPASPGVGDRLEEAIADLPIVTVKDQAEFAEEQRAPIDQFVLLIFALLALALVIAVLGIVNTLALSVIERTREVGLLRAIGLSRRQLRWMITLESVVIAVLGAVLGVLLGTFFGIVLMYALRDEGLEVISVPTGQLAVFLALSVLIGVLAAVLPARRAARLDVLRAIATE
ncbi:ABC transporter permease [Nocardioides lianchengensis]|uniref:Putative ABC transport system permease protein n=1 Tax=Nocardioides lianchengensis TaxID=1045774 RepID=A0A1G6I5G8_9ACTN|nr:ABC transporter permease [Nocardioides lianchengensis]NYG13166.1 putative ABC transport system permease protein [Nocardioides lianchengensis]SDC01623.1 putative ABC transport system permease protein [Nocardioides lianchengensis]